MFRVCLETAVNRIVAVLWMIAMDSFIYIGINVSSY